MQFCVNILRIVCIIKWKISFMSIMTMACNSRIYAATATSAIHRYIKSERAATDGWMEIFRWILFLTLYENRSETSHTKTASLPTGTVIFAIDELKLGSAAAGFFEMMCRVNKYTAPFTNQKPRHIRRVRGRPRMRGKKTFSNNYYYLWRAGVPSVFTPLRY